MDLLSPFKLYSSPTRAKLLLNERDLNSSYSPWRTKDTYIFLSVERFSSEENISLPLPLFSGTLFRIRNVVYILERRRFRPTLFEFSTLDVIYFGFLMLNQHAFRTKNIIIYPSLTRGYTILGRWRV